MATLSSFDAKKLSRAYSTGSIHKILAQKRACTYDPMPCTPNLIANGDDKSKFFPLSMTQRGQTGSPRLRCKSEYSKTCVGTQAINKNHISKTYIPNVW